MREIKFRAWDKEEKTMIYDVEKTYDYGCKGYGALETSFGDLLENEKFEVMQFTGLYDKNDAEIYEGDICSGGSVLCTGGYSIWTDKATVKYESGMFKLGSLSLITFARRTEVIGNIHENPELLGGESEAERNENNPGF